MDHLIIDSREPKDIIDHFCSLGARKEQLNVGDYLFESDDSLVIVERKELADARHSIVDGRWSDQKSRMNDIKESHGQEKKVVCMILIEGKRGLGPDPWEQYESKSVVSETTLDHAILNSAILDSIYVLMVQTRKDLIHVLEYIATITHPKHTISKNRLTAKSIGNTPKQKVFTDIFRNQLLLIHGVSGDAADAICNIYDSLYTMFVDFQNHGEKELIQKIANLKKQASQRKIGQAVATRIVSSLTPPNKSAI